MSTILSLLSRGFIPNDNSINQSEINKVLYNLGYSTVMWYDESMLILKDLNESEGNIKIKEKELKDIIIEIIDSISEKECDLIKTIKYTTLNYLKDKNIIKIENDKILLTELFIVQNENFLLEFRNVKKCKFCNILCFNENEHMYCLKKYYSELSKVK